MMFILSVAATFPLKKRKTRNPLLPFTISPIDNLYYLVNTSDMSILTSTKIPVSSVTHLTSVDDSGDFPRLKREVVMTPEDKARLLRERGVLLNLRGHELIEKAVEIALDDSHAGQMTAMKMLVERLLPMSVFEEAKSTANRPQISINITGLNDISIEDGMAHATDADKVRSADADIIDADIVEGNGV